MSGADDLKQRVEQRDRLVAQAEYVGQKLHDQVLGAFARGEVALAEAAAHQHDLRLRELTENLRIYQAELHAQADELAASHEHTEAMVRRFSALFASLPIACLLVTFNGEVLECNAMAARLLDIRPNANTLRFMHRMVDAGDYQQRVRPGFHEAQALGACALDTLAFLGEGGRRFIGDLHLSRLPGGESLKGSSLQFVCAVIDRSEHLHDLQALAAQGSRLAEMARQLQALALRVQQGDGAACVALLLALAGDLERQAGPGPARPAPPDLPG